MIRKYIIIAAILGLAGCNASAPTITNTQLQAAVAAGCAVAGTVEAIHQSSSTVQTDTVAACTTAAQVATIAASAVAATPASAASQ